MQKKLIALAVAGALAPAVAMAQSTNVTIYGVADVGFQNGKANGALVSTADAPSRNRVNSSSSLLGVRGTEDLGGGLSAVYQFETTISPDTAGAWAGVRDHFVGLDSKQWGTLRLGNITTGFRLLGVMVDVMPGGTNIGSLTGAAGGVMGAYAYGAINTATGAGIAGANSGAANFNNRVANSVNYKSPMFGGFWFDATYGANEGKTTAIDPELWNITGAFASGPFKIAAGYESHDDFANGLPAALTTVAGVTTHTEDDAWRIVGEYVFGNFTFRLGYENAEWTTNSKVAGNADKVETDTWVIGGKWKIGNGEIRGQYADQSMDLHAVGESSDSADSSMWTIGYGHMMSKRTELYVYYAQINNDDTTGVSSLGGINYKVANATDIANGGTFLAAPAAGAVGGAGADPRVFTLGIRHLF